MSEADDAIAHLVKIRAQLLLIAKQVSYIENKIKASKVADQDRTVKDEAFYESDDGNSWSLQQDPTSGRLSVRHRPAPLSGGETAFIEVDEFLRQSPMGPQHDALSALIDSKIPIKF